MAESYSDEEFMRLTHAASNRARLMETCIKLRARLDRARRDQDKAEDAAGRLGEDLLVARRERDEAKALLRRALDVERAIAKKDAADVRREALEEAAKLVEAYPVGPKAEERLASAVEVAERDALIAAVIRALKDGAK